MARTEKAGRFGMSHCALTLALTSALACVSASPPAEGLLPLGPGPEIRLGVRGMVNMSPSIAARDPLVAIAWTAAAPDGRGDVYIVTSEDNGATFSAPRKVGPTGVDAERPARVVFEWPRLDERGRMLFADIRVEWTFREQGRDVQRGARSTDGGRTFVDDPDGRVRLFYTGGADAPQLALDRLIGTGPERVGIAHPQIAPQEDRSVVTVWDEVNGGARRVMLRRVLPGAGGSVQSMDTMPLSGSLEAIAPAIGSVAGGVIVAWTSDRPPASMIAVRRVGLDLLCTTQPVRVEYEGGSLGRP